MSDLSNEISNLTGLPEVHITDTTDHLKPAVDKINEALAVVPADLQHELVHHVVSKLFSWLLAHFKK